MDDNIKNYINACQTCQKFGETRRKEPLHPIRVGQPYNRVGMDLIRPLLVTKQNNQYIVIITKYLTKWPEVQPIPSKHAEYIAHHFHKEVICRHGCPKEILTDQGLEFQNQFFNSLCNLYGIRHKLSSAYHPQTNGLTERFNRTLCNSLTKLAHE